MKLKTWPDTCAQTAAAHCIAQKKKKQQLGRDDPTCCQAVYLRRAFETDTRRVSRTRAELKCILLMDEKFQYATELGYTSEGMGIIIFDNDLKVSSVFGTIYDVYLL